MFYMISPRHLAKYVSEELDAALYLPTRLENNNNRKSFAIYAKMYLYLLDIPLPQ